MYKKKYYYLVVSYNAIEDGKRVYCQMSINTSSEKHEKGFPTFGAVVKTVRDFCKKIGREYTEGSVVITFFTEITKEQYEAINDEKEPTDATEE